MSPTWDLLGLRVPMHPTWVALGLLAAVATFAHEKRRRHLDDPHLWMLAALALGWGGVFMILGTWLQHWDLRRNASLVEQLVYGNRSIIGGLFGAYVGVHLGKRILGVRTRTGALFAPAAAIGLAVGRVGCLLTERPGTPTAGGWGITLDPETAARLGSPAGVGLHPSFGYEIAFHLVALALLVRFRDRLRDPADLLTCYLAAYLVFRFGVEQVRGNEEVWAGLTRPQLVILAATPLVAWALAQVVRRERRPAPDRPAESRRPSLAGRA